MSDLSKSSLSPARKRLVELMQHMHFGRVERLVVRGGEPVFDPGPRVIRKLKMGGRNEPRSEAAAEDFVLRREVIELLEQVQGIGNGCIDRIEIAHGLPFVLEIEEPTTT